MVLSDLDSGEQTRSENPYSGFIAVKMAECSLLFSFFFVLIFLHC